MIWKWNALCASLRNNSHAGHFIPRRVYVACFLQMTIRSLSSPLDTPSLPSTFFSNDCRTLFALRATVRERFTGDAILFRKNSDSQNISGKGRGSKGSKKKIREFGALPCPYPITLATQATSWRPHSSVPRFLPNLVMITGIVLKCKLLQAFSVISVQVRIFTGLDRNDLKWSLRISEILLFIIIGLWSFVLHPPSCMWHVIWSYTKSYAFSWPIATHKKKRNKKGICERDPELNSCRLTARVIRRQLLQEECASIQYIFHGKNLILSTLSLTGNHQYNHRRVILKGLNFN